MNNKIAPLAPLSLTPSNSKGKTKSSSLAPLSGLSTPSSSLDKLEKLEKPKSSGSGNKSSSERKKARKLKMEKLRQTKYATHIQAAWRGSRVRKNGGGGKQNSTSGIASKHFFSSYEKSMKDVNVTPETEVEREIVSVSVDVSANIVNEEEKEKKQENILKESSLDTPVVTNEEQKEKEKDKEMGDQRTESDSDAVKENKSNVEESKDEPSVSQPSSSLQPTVDDETSTSQDKISTKAEEDDEEKEKEEEKVTDEKNQIPLVQTITLPTAQSITTDPVELTAQMNKQSESGPDTQPEAEAKDDTTTSNSPPVSDEKNSNEDKQAVDEDPPPLPHEPSVWPTSYHDSFTTIGDTDTPWPNLNPTTPPSSDSNSDSQSPSTATETDSVLQWVMKHQQVLTRTVTWNMQAHDPPSVVEVQKILLPLNKFHVIGFGTEECERSIAKSALNPSKKNWESYLLDLVGPRYTPLRSHTLQAIHLMVFVHKSILPLITNVSSAAVACGLGNTLGNKGGVGISFRIANSRILILNTHLSAHQHKVEERNDQVWKILNELPVLLKLDMGDEKDDDKKVTKREKESNGDEKTDQKSAQKETLSADVGDSKELDTDTVPSANEETPDTKKNDDESSIVVTKDSTAIPVADKPSSQSSGISDTSGVDKIEKYYDCLIFMGDMNYRINGNRKVIDKLIDANMHEVLMFNDQLTVSFNQQKLPHFLVESPVTFRPTYKFDKDSDVYDTSAKQRIPSWTDRILYTKSNLTCLTYNSVPDIRISDHRPVYASFLTNILVHKEHVMTKKEDNVAYSSESQVCTIM